MNIIIIIIVIMFQDTNAMSQETFEAEKASLIKYYNDKLTLNDLSNAFWDIIKREHDFDSIKFKIHTLYKITLQELYSFFKVTIL